MSERRSLIGGLLTALSLAAGFLSAAVIVGQALPVLAQTAPAEGSKKSDPADARKDVINGVKAFEKGKMEEAIELLTKGLKSGGLASADTAKALYYRGLANRRSGKPAQAISDLTSALWLKEGLTEAERKKALENRSAAYAEAGLKDPGMDVIAGSEESGATQVASKSSSSSSSFSSSSSSSSSGGALSGVGDFFSSLFGGGSSSSANAGTAEPGPAASETVETNAAPAASVSAWNSATEVAPAQALAQQWETSARPAAQADARPAAKPTNSAAQGKVQKKGRFEVHVAAVRSREEAERLAQEVTQKHAGVLGERVAEIEETVFGNMGTFYRVSIGPFAKADETTDICKALKAGGYDCMVAKN